MTLKPPRASLRLLPSNGSDSGLAGAGSLRLDTRRAWRHARNRFTICVRHRPRTWGSALYPFCKHTASKVLCMTPYAFLAVGTGAAVGAWLRWGFGLWLNPALPNCLGHAVFQSCWRLSGRSCGGVFHAASGLVARMALVHPHRFFLRVDHFFCFFGYAWSAVVVAAHLGGSLLMTVLGMQTFKWLHA